MKEGRHKRLAIYDSIYMNCQEEVNPQYRNHPGGCQKLEERILGSNYLMGTRFPFVETIVLELYRDGGCTTL